MYLHETRGVREKSNSTNNWTPLPQFPSHFGGQGIKGASLLNNSFPFLDVLLRICREKNLTRTTVGLLKGKAPNSIIIVVFWPFVLL